MAIWNGRPVVLGACNEAKYFLDSAEVYYKETNEWVLYEDVLPKGRGHFGLVIYDEGD